MKKEIKEYLSEIGKVGGKKSKRVLTPEQAKEMVRMRELKRKAQQSLDGGKDE